MKMQRRRRRVGRKGRGKGRESKASRERERVSSCNWMLCLCAAYILLMCARGTCVCSAWERKRLGRERGERGERASACVSERRELLLFRAIRYPALLLARGLCYTFLINYKLLQIYLQAGITFIPPPSLPYTPHCLLVCISLVRLKSPVCVCVCTILSPPSAVTAPAPPSAFSSCMCVYVCVLGNFVFSA